MCSGTPKNHRVLGRDDSHAKAWARRSIVLKHTALQRCAVPSPSFRMGNRDVQPVLSALWFFSARQCLLTMVIALAAGRVAGQSVERLQVRADSLLREWRRASALADMVDSLNHGRAAGGTDTISVGVLRIVATPSPARLREAAARAWPVIDSLYGSEAQQLAQRPYLIAPYDPDTTSPKPMLRGAIQVPWDKDVASLAMLLLTNVPIGRPDRALQNWLGGVGAADHSSAAGARRGLCAARDRSLSGSPQLFPWRDRRLPQRAGVERVTRSAATMVSERRRATSLGVSVVRGVLRLFRSRRAQVGATAVRSGQRCGVHRAAAVAAPRSPATPTDLRCPRGAGAGRVTAGRPSGISPPGRDTR